VKSEKITINLSAVELAQIDFLVERGLYVSRSDFIRLATRKQTEEHKKEIENFVDPLAGNGSAVALGLISDTLVWSLGMAWIEKDHVEELFLTGKKLDIRVIGVVKIAKDVNPDQFERVLKRCKVFGKVNAEPEIKAIIEALTQKSER